MKKRILSVLLGCSLLVGTVFTNAVSIEFEEIAETDSLNLEVDSNILSEDIEFSKEEITETKFLLYNFPKAINIEEGTLEYVKTIVGNSYTSFTKKDENNHYWSQNYGYENIISNILKDALLASGEISHLESEENDQSPPNRNDQCTSFSFL